jgi:hypothetical protein
MYNNIYRVWKFAAYLILPLSFIFPSSILFIVKRYFYKHKVLLSTIQTILCLLFFLNVIYLFPYKEIPSKYFKASSFTEFNKNLSLLSLDFNDIDNFYFYYYDIHKTLPTITMLSGMKKNLYFIKQCYFIGNNKFNLNSISPNSIFISDIKSTGLINSTINPESYSKMGFYVYDYKYILENGTVALQEVAPPTGPKFFEIVLPPVLIGKNILVSLNMAPEENIDEKCPMMDLSLVGESDAPISSKSDHKTISAIIPASFTEKGFLAISLTPPISAKLQPDPKTQPSDGNNEPTPQIEENINECRFTIRSLELSLSSEK